MHSQLLGCKHYLNNCVAGVRKSLICLDPPLPPTWVSKLRKNSVARLPYMRGSHIPRLLWFKNYSIQKLFNCLAYCCIIQWMLLKILDRVIAVSQDRISLSKFHTKHSYLKTKELYSQQLPILLQALDHHAKSHLGNYEKKQHHYKMHNGKNSKRKKRKAGILILRIFVFFFFFFAAIGRGEKKIKNIPLQALITRSREITRIKFHPSP